jgi:TolA-binding protein
MLQKPTSLNTIFLDEFSLQKKENEQLRTISQRLAVEKQQLEIKIRVLEETIEELRDRLERSIT